MNKQYIINRNFVLNWLANNTAQPLPRAFYEGVVKFEIENTPEYENQFVVFNSVDEDWACRFALDARFVSQYMTEVT